ncbi:MAG: hypothetical protein ACKOWD_01545 [Rhodoferax sp.]
MNIALPWIAGALVVCWLVGVHNRLLRLRAVALDARVVFERTLRALIAVASEAVSSAKAPESICSALDTAGQALEAGLKSYKAPRRFFWSAPERADVGVLWERLQQVWLAYAVAAEGVEEPAVLQALRDRWHAADTQAPLDRSAANLAIADYQNALSQAPAAWVARVLGFRWMALL